MKKIDVKNLSKKQKKQLNTWLRAVIQLLYFLFLPSAFTAAFGGVKYMFTQIGVEAKIELTSFVAVLLVLCAYTIVFGRFFCGFACAFGSLGDALHAMYLKICKKLKKKPVSLKKEWEQWLILLKYVLKIQSYQQNICHVLKKRQPKPTVSLKYLLNKTYASVSSSA